MKQILRTRISPVLMLFLCTTAAAQVAPRPSGLKGAVDSSLLIIVGRLDQYIAEPEPVDRAMQEKFRSSSMIAGGNVEMMVASTINPRGTYVFHVLSTLKGAAPQPLVVRLRRVTSDGGMVRISTSETSIPLKATYMLLLTGSEKSGFTALYRAPIRISDKATLPPAPIVSDEPDAMLSAVLGILLDSLQEPETRGVAASLLADTVSPKAADAMRKYLDDPDDGLRAAAIQCLAINQDVTVIPRIANWKYSDPNRSGNGLLINLSKFKTPDAIPYLNQLLLDKTSPYIPLNAASALRQLPLDKSSTPFWMVALHDTEQQGIAAYAAYNSLHKMYPELGPPGNVMEFRNNRAEETRKLDEWWADEQAGKHSR
jgi:hypothetical protein